MSFIIKFGKISQATAGVWGQNGEPSSFRPDHQEGRWSPRSPVSALDLSHLEALPKQEVAWEAIEVTVGSG